MKVAVRVRASYVTVPATGPRPSSSLKLVVVRVDSFISLLKVAVTRVVKSTPMASNPGKRWVTTGGGSPMTLCTYTCPFRSSEARTTSPVVALRICLLEVGLLTESYRRSPIKVGAYLALGFLQFSGEKLILEGGTVMSAVL